MADKFGGFGNGTSARQAPTNTPKPTPTPNTQNLTSALRGSLTLITNEDENNSENIPSPLLEASPDSIDILLDRINTGMIEGKILSDEDLKLGIELYRAQALRFAQEAENKKPRARKQTPVNKQVLDLELEF